MGHWPDLERRVDALIAAGEGPPLVFQPIVDMTRGRIVGYEALSRFPGPLEASPEDWFAAAHRIGRRSELEALVIGKALDARISLPTNTFLSVNVGPHALVSDQVLALIYGRSLAPIVFELTEHAAISDSGYGVLSQTISTIRKAGGFIAVDDAGAGYASLQHILALRPDFVKLDRSLIVDLQLDDAKTALVEMFGDFTNRIDAWLIAEGIEKDDELRRLLQLGVPLGQGYLLGRPDPDMRGLEASFAEILVAAARPMDQEILRFVDSAVTAPQDAADATLMTILALHKERPALVLVDDDHPVQLALRAGPSRVTRRGVSTVLASTEIREALSRAMTRPADRRFDPLVCTDALGRCQGLVPIDRLVLGLAGQQH